MAVSRRTLISGVSALGLSAFAHSRVNSLMNFSASELAHPLTPVPLEQVTLEDEFWTPKRNIWRSITLWDCFKKFEEQGSGVLNNFDRVRDGLKSGHAGFPWHDGLIYEMIRAGSDFLRSQPDPELEAKLDGWVTRIVDAASKDPTGYLNTYTQLEAPEQRYGLNGGLEVWQHEFYNLGALVDAGVHYYRATRKTNLLAAGIKIANTLSELLQPQLGRNLVPAHELGEEAMLGLEALLAENPGLLEQFPDAKKGRYQALAEFWIENRGKNAGEPHWGPDRSIAEKEVRHFDYAKGRPSWGDYAQDSTPILQQSQVVGHAVRSTLLCSAVAATARLNHRKDYEQTAIRLWENMVYRRMHITGGVGAFANEEAFGPDYVLPNNAYLETCAAVGAGFFHANMNATFGEGRYVDELERALYNGILCGISLAGDRYTYVNPLVTDESSERWSWHECPCCPPMLLKMMGMLPSFIYSTDSHAAYVNLFVGSRASMKVKGQNVAIRQTTNYPWQGKVTLEIQPEQPLTSGLMIRIPGWAKSSSFKINHQVVKPDAIVRGYARFERTWKVGDLIELEMPLPVELIEGDPKVEANIGRIAVKRGPLIYCFESIDKNDLKNLKLNRSTPGQVEMWSDQLGQVAAIRVGSATAIPFYANRNRGPAQMAVWIPAEA